LGVDIAAICPRQLRNKEEYALEQAIRSAQWDEDWSYTDEDEELDWRLETLETRAREHAVGEDGV
jgi:hypothetical protein